LAHHCDPRERRFVCPSKKTEHVVGNRRGFPQRGDRSSGERKGGGNRGRTRRISPWLKWQKIDSHPPHVEGKKKGDGKKRSNGSNRTRFPNSGERRGECLVKGSADRIKRWEAAKRKGGWTELKRGFADAKTQK